jgi:ABC-2 type transport system permease protein
MAKSGDVKEVAVVDYTGKYSTLFKDTEEYKFVMVTPPNALPDSKELIATLQIMGDLLENPKAAVLTSTKQIPQDLKREVNNTLNRFLEKEKRASFNVPNIDEIIDKSHVNFDIQTIKQDKGGKAKASSSEIASAIGFLFTFMIYMFIMIYGAMVMQGVMEEKTNRIVEVMISSVRPFDLMMGKITGIGLVGLTQVCIWVVLTVILVSIGGLFIDVSGINGAELMSVQGVGTQSAAVATAVGDSLAVDILNKLSSFNFVEIIVCFILYFIGGYITYASLYAAAGAAVDNPEDSQQFLTPIILFLVFGVYAGIYSVQNPDGPLAFWCSFLPFTSPIVMMVRIPFDVPLWQILLSLGVSFLTAGLLVWVSGKIYRTGILMYGKKPTFRELARWVRYN